METAVPTAVNFCRTRINISEEACVFYTFRRVHDRVRPRRSMAKLLEMYALYFSFLLPSSTYANIP